MAEQIPRDELLELTKFAPHLAIAECVPGLSCDVFAGGEEMDLDVGLDVSQQLPGCELRNIIAVTGSTRFEYWLLVRLRVRGFRPFKGPLSAGQLRAIFSGVIGSSSGVDDAESNTVN